MRSVPATQTRTYLEYPKKGDLIEMTQLQRTISTILKTVSTISFAALVTLSVPSILRADVIFVGPVDMSGTGFGAVNTVMTMQALGSQMGSIETGCVGVSDSGRLNTTVQWLQQHHQSDPDLCQGGNTGGFEKPPSNFPHNQTLPVSDASTIEVVFNSDQPAGGTVSLSNLVFVLFNGIGQVGFTSGPTSQVFSSTESEPGIGNSGWEFALDSTQANAAQAAIFSGFDLFGLSATVTDSTGGPETFFLVNNQAGTPVPPPPPVPEPASLLLFGTGLLVIGALCRRLIVA